TRCCLRMWPISAYEMPLYTSHPLCAIYILVAHPLRSSIVVLCSIYFQEESMTLDRDTVLRLYETMAMIRAFETRVRDEFARGRIPGFVHLYVGEEAVATGVCAHL